jgi:hypothetical protein
MTHMLSLLPVLACAATLAIMSGAGAIAWLATSTPLRRPSWFERRARHAHPTARDVEQGSRS